jgi:hypothetical protein
MNRFSLFMVYLQSCWSQISVETCMFGYVCVAKDMYVHINIWKYAHLYAPEKFLVYAHACR